METSSAAGAADVVTDAPQIAGESLAKGVCSAAASASAGLHVSTTTDVVSACTTGYSPARPPVPSAAVPAATPVVSATAPGTIEGMDGVRSEGGAASMDKTATDEDPRSWLAKYTSGGGATSHEPALSVLPPPLSATAASVTAASIAAASSGPSTKATAALTAEVSASDPATEVNFFVGKPPVSQVGDAKLPASQVGDAKASAPQEGDTKASARQVVSVAEPQAAMVEPDAATGDHPASGGGDAPDKVDKPAWLAKYVSSDPPGAVAPTAEEPQPVTTSGGATAEPAESTVTDAMDGGTAASMESAGTAASSIPSSSRTSSRRDLVGDSVTEGNGGGISAVDGEQDQRLKKKKRNPFHKLKKMLSKDYREMKKSQGLAR